MGIDNQDDSSGGGAAGNYSGPNGSSAHDSNTEVTAWADFESQEGTQQGCPLGPALFAMWFRPHMRWIQTQIQARCGPEAAVVGQMDDAAAMATPAPF